MRGLVACYEPQAAEAGRQIFAQGGNVADAAIAAAYAQCVVNPFACGLSGKASIHFYNARTREDLVLDAGHTVGSRATPTVFADKVIRRIEKVGGYLVEGNINAVGYQSILTPGFVPGTHQLFKRFGSGRLSWRALIEPAARLAAEGFPIYPQIAHYWYDGTDPHGRPSVSERLAMFPAARQIFLKPGGRPYANGELLVQADLGRTLRRIAEEGPELFYRGEIARQLAADIEQNGGFVSYEDMAEFPVEPKKPLELTYRGYRVTANPLPGNGLVALLMLNILEGYDLAAMGHNSPAYIETVVRAMHCAFEDRSRYRGDPRFVDVPVEMLLSKERGAYWRQEIAAGRGPTRVKPPATAGTTHLAVMDDEGNAVSMTHSIGSPGGSGAVAPGLGVLYNNHMSLLNPQPGTVDSIYPGRRGGGSVPLILFQGHEPVMAIGGAGGTRQVTGTIQSILNVVEHGMSMSEAIAAPRIHSEEPGVILCDPQFPESCAAALRQRGFEVRPSASMGRVVGVTRRPADRSLEGGSDTRNTFGRGFVGYFANE